MIQAFDLRYRNIYRFFLLFRGFRPIWVMATTSTPVWRFGALAHEGGLHSLCLRPISMHIEDTQVRCSGSGMLWLLASLAVVAVGFEISCTLIPELAFMVYRPAPFWNLCCQAFPLRGLHVACPHVQLLDISVLEELSTIAYACPPLIQRIRCASLRRTAMHDTCSHHCSCQ